MNGDVIVAGVSFTANDRRLYSEDRLDRLAQLLLEHRSQKQVLYDFCEQQMHEYDNDQLIVQQFEGTGIYVFTTLYLLYTERVRLKYEMVLRWLQLVRWHQADLCWHGFGRSQAHLAVGNSLVRLHSKEMELRCYADSLGIPTAHYRQMYF